ncbi:MAG: hypothetical protein IIB71_15430 [Proteobacteria bacterium]|nr:hypothetical protein [Pseudomonadota bacterium]
MHAFIKFNKGMMQMPIQWQAWLVLLVTANLVIPLFYLNRIEAQVVLATIMASMILMIVLTALTGFTRLLGLGHVLWIPLIYFLWLRLEQNPADDFFGIWIRVLMILNATSLVIDSVDVARYITGDRSETVQGL